MMEEALRQSLAQKEAENCALWETINKLLQEESEQTKRMKFARDFFKANQQWADSEHQQQDLQQRMMQQDKHLLTMQEEVEQFTKSCKHTEWQRKQLQRELETARMENEDLNGNAAETIQALLHEQQDQTSQLHNLTELCQTRASACLRLKHENKELSDQIRTLEDEKGNMLEALENMEVNLKEKHEAIELAEELIKELLACKNSADRSNTDLVEANTDLLGKCNEYDQTVLQLKKQLQTQQEKKYNKKQLEEKIRELEETVKQSTADKRKIQDELRRKIIKLKAVEADVQTTKQRVVGLEETTHKHNTQHQSLMENLNLLFATIEFPPLDDRRHHNSHQDDERLLGDDVRSITNTSISVASSRTTKNSKQHFVDMSHEDKLKFIVGRYCCYKDQLVRYKADLQCKQQESEEALRLVTEKDQLICSLNNELQLYKGRLFETEQKLQVGSQAMHREEVLKSELRQERNEKAQLRVQMENDRNRWDEDYQSFQHTKQTAIEVIEREKHVILKEKDGLQIDVDSLHNQLRVIAEEKEVLERMVNEYKQQLETTKEDNKKNTESKSKQHTAEIQRKQQQVSDRDETIRLLQTDVTLWKNKAKKVQSQLEAKKWKCKQLSDKYDANNKELQDLKEATSDDFAQRINTEKAIYERCEKRLNAALADISVEQQKVCKKITGLTSSNCNQTTVVNNIHDALIKKLTEKIDRSQFGLSHNSTTDTPSHGCNQTEEGTPLTKCTPTEGNVSTELVNLFGCIVNDSLPENRNISKSNSNSSRSENDKPANLSIKQIHLDEHNGSIVTLPVNAILAYYKKHSLASATERQLVVDINEDLTHQLTSVTTALANQIDETKRLSELLAKCMTDYAPPTKEPIATDTPGNHISLSSSTPHTHNNNSLMYDPTNNPQTSFMSPINLTFSDVSPVRGQGSSSISAADNTTHHSTNGAPPITPTKNVNSSTCSCSVSPLVHTTTTSPSSTTTTQTSPGNSSIGYSTQYNNSSIMSTPILSAKWSPLPQSPQKHKPGIHTKTPDYPHNIEHHFVTIYEFMKECHSFTSTNLGVVYSNYNSLLFYYVTLITVLNKMIHVNFETTSEAQRLSHDVILLKEMLGSAEGCNEYTKPVDVTDVHYMDNIVDIISSREQSECTEHNDDAVQPRMSTTKQHHDTSSGSIPSTIPSDQFSLDSANADECVECRCSSCLKKLKDQKCKQTQRSHNRTHGNTSCDDRNPYPHGHHQRCNHNSPQGSKSAQYCSDAEPVTPRQQHTIGTPPRRQSMDANNNNNKPCATPTWSKSTKPHPNDSPPRAHSYQTTTFHRPSTPPRQRHHSTTKSGSNTTVRQPRSVPNSPSRPPASPQQVRGRRNSIQQTTIDTTSTTLTSHRSQSNGHARPCIMGMEQLETTTTDHRIHHQHRVNTHPPVLDIRRSSNLLTHTQSSAAKQHIASKAKTPVGNYCHGHGNNITLDRADPHNISNHGNPDDINSYAALHLKSKRSFVYQDSNESVFI